MSKESLERERRIVLEEWAAVEERWLWLLAAMATSGMVFLAYVLTHPYPAYAGGLYLEIAEQIGKNGYALPKRIPGYSAGGIPFAYPPLMFYVTSAIVDLFGIEPLVLLRYLPGVVVIASLVPYFGIAEELLGDSRKAGLATILLGLTPTTLRWHLSAGGLVRAPAFLLALSGIYVGLKLFRSGERRWLVAGTGCFGLLVMTHPTYSVFFVLSYLLIYATFDRSADGLLKGFLVGIGGLSIAAPWWAHVVATHGLQIFATAAGTHGGLGGGLYRLAVQVTYPLDNFDVEWPFYVAAYLGSGYYLRERRFFLPAWMVGSSYFIGKNRFLFVAGSMLTAAFVFDTLIPRIRGPWVDMRRVRVVSIAILLLVTVAAATAGTLFGAGAVVAVHGDSHAQPQYMDDEDREAMEWIEWNTHPSARFVALGDAAEYLPYLTDRTILVGPWGVEWESTKAYYHQMALYDEISACHHPSCLSYWLAREHIHPEYIYVPKGDYTVRGKEYEQSATIKRSLENSGRYDIVYENEGVVVARVIESPSTPRPTPGATRSAVVASTRTVSE